MDAQTPDGKTNWLAIQESQYQRTWSPSQPMPSSIVGPAVLNRIMNAQGFETFGTSRNSDQKNLDPRWVPMGGGSQGILEATPHNNIHNNIGGYMPTSASPRDPIFFMHHGNIDRIWALWNLRNANSADTLWTGMQFTNNYLNPDGSFWSPKVSDLYSPEALGYTYGLAGQVAPTGTRKMLLSRKLDAVFAVNGTALGLPASVRTASVANTKTATASEPLEIAVQVPPAGLDAARRGVVKGLFNLEADASGTRVLAFLRDVTVTNAQDTMFHVFVDAPEVSAATPTTDRHYVGTFGVLQHSVHHGELPSFVLDITDAIRR
jgi:tyrosinase